MTTETAVKEETGTEDLGAPLYVAWQITNECNLACLHCIEESGPSSSEFFMSLSMRKGTPCSRFPKATPTTSAGTTPSCPT